MPDPTPAEALLADLARVEAALADVVPRAKRLQRDANAAFAEVRTLNGARDDLLRQAEALLASTRSQSAA